MLKNFYYVYMLTDKNNRVLYIGQTNDLLRRLYEHKNKLADGFTKRYNVDKLVYYEICEDVMSTIEREKQLKRWTRAKKNKLVESINPNWEELQIN
ncbi:MAG: GIY-YIG nuclease family protein [Clostridia bacterium]|nr:GIY-YIG nuclease family protein [Clostridia bacterium]